MSTEQFWNKIQCDTFESFWSSVRWRTDGPIVSEEGEKEKDLSGVDIFLSMCDKIFTWLASY